MLRRRSRATLLMVALVTVAQPALAQESVLVAPPDLPDFDRGRNVSVRQAYRPDFAQVGIRRGSFELYPRVLIGGGASDNIYATPVDRVGDVYAVLAPSMDVRSDWSRHQLSLDGGYALRRYANETRRNQDEWHVNGLGRIDLGNVFALAARAGVAQAQETIFSGAIDADLAALSSYRRRTAELQGQYTEGRLRATLAYNLEDFSFDDIPQANGANLSQRDRDREIHRLSAQMEVALSPSLSLFSRLVSDQIGYDTRLRDGGPSRSGEAYRAIVGSHFDVSAFLRGSIGAGYAVRNYDASEYGTAEGMFVEALVEYFPTQLTTVTLSAHRLLDDTSISNTSAYFDNRAELRVDHELLSNLIVEVHTTYLQQEFVDAPLRSRIVGGGAGARYLVSRGLELAASLAYSHRSEFGSAAGASVDETAFLLNATFKR